LLSSGSSAQPAGVRKALWGFAYATWVYRTLVFIGIAALVYWMFPKPLGPLLAAVEIGWFLVRPILNEMRAWMKLRNEIVRAPGRARPILLLAIVLLLVGVPWDARIGAQALLKPMLQQPIVAPSDARVRALRVAHGALVRVDDLLFELEAPDLAAQLEAARIRANALTWRAEGAGVDSDLRESRAIIAAEQARVAAEIAALELELARNAVRAERAGTFLLTRPDVLTVGTWVARNELLGRVVDANRWEVVAYLDERTLDRVAVGDSARFIAESGARAPVPLTVQRIDPDATRVLPDALLAATHGGEILVREQDDQLIPEHSLYRVVLIPDEPIANGSMAQTLRGHLVIRGKPRAWATDTVRSILAALRRETGL